MTKITAVNDSKPDNYQVNAKICRQVERFPCMYDRSHLQYLKKDVVDKAWVKIAKEMDDSIPSCKERWRNIRTSFARSINVNKVPASANRTKPYYLHEELQFLAKHITPGIPIPRRSNTTNYYSASEESETIEVAVGEESFDGFIASVQDEDISQEPVSCSLDETLHMSLTKNETIDGISQAEGELESQQQLVHENTIPIQPPAQESQHQEQPHLMLPAKRVSTEPPESSHATPLYPPKKRQCTHEYYASDSSRDHDHEFEHRRERERDIDRGERDIKPAELPQESDFDSIFLQGLLPEMKAMDFRQKVSFKRRIYEVISEIFDNTATTSGLETQARNTHTPTISRVLNIPPPTPAPAAVSSLNTYTTAAPTMAVVNAADLAMIRRLNTLLQSPTGVASSTGISAMPKNVASISSTVHTTLASAGTATVAVHRGALTRSGSNLLRVTMVNPPAPLLSAPSSAAHVKQEPDTLED